MSKSKRVVVPLFVIFLLTVFSSGNALAVRSENHLFVVFWTWLNPLEGVSYKMYQYADGTIVAIRLPGYRGKIYTIDPGGAYKSRVPDDKLQPPPPPPQPDDVYKMWQERSLRCEVMRTTPDLFGVPFKSCQVVPFRYVYGRARGMSARGEVWVFLPPRPGKQEMPSRGSAPRWGN